MDIAEQRWWGNENQEARCGYQGVQGKKWKNNRTQKSLIAVRRRAMDASIFELFDKESEFHQQVAHSYPKHLRINQPPPFFNTHPVIYVTINPKSNQLNCQFLPKLCLRTHCQLVQETKNLAFPSVWMVVEYSPCWNSQLKKRNIA